MAINATGCFTIFHKMKTTDIDPLNYIGQNKDWGEFINFVSDNTGEHFENLWLENITKNKKRYEMYGWAAPVLQGIHRGKTAVMLGASPAIEKQFDILRNLQ